MNFFCWFLGDKVCLRIKIVWDHHLWGWQTFLKFKIFVDHKFWGIDFWWVKNVGRLNIQEIKNFNSLGTPTGYSVPYFLVTCHLLTAGKKNNWDIFCQTFFLPEFFFCHQFLFIFFFKSTIFLARTFFHQKFFFCLKFFPPNICLLPKMSFDNFFLPNNFSRQKNTTEPKAAALRRN